MNIDSLRDWGHAKDYVDAMWRMLQHDVPEDFVIATGKQISVRKFVELSFAEVGIRIQWEGEGVQEVGRNAETGDVVVAAVVLAMSRATSGPLRWKRCWGSKGARDPSGLVG